MQSSNLYFVYNSGSQQQFWQRKLINISNELRYKVMNDDSETYVLFKIGKLMKQNIARGYKIFQQHLFYFRENGELGGFTSLKNVYCSIDQRQTTQNLPYNCCIRLLKDHTFIQLYCNYNEENKQFITEIQKFCILFDFEKHYQLQQQIGTGSTADVFLAKKNKDQQYYAVKKIRKEGLNNRNRKLKSQTLLEEIYNMRFLQHPNIMKLYEVFESETHVFLILNLFEGGQLLEKVKQFNFATKKELCRKLFETVNYMHSMGIMHRDLKPYNILYKNNDVDNLQFGIGDFGFSTSIKQSQHVLQKCGTPGYVAPEIIDHKEGNKMYGPLCDVFSLGVITYEIFFNTHPFRRFRSQTREETLRLILTSEIQFDERVIVPASLTALIISMTRKEPRHRFTLNQCLEHDFFKEIDVHVSQEPLPNEIRTTRCQTLQQIQKKCRVRETSLQDWRNIQETVDSHSIPQFFIEPQMRRQRRSNY